MTWDGIQILAGAFSSLIFACGTLTMLFKVWKTKDVNSFSFTSLVMNNLGNLIYWLYVLSIPFGPIYLLHGFYTLSTILMLIWYLIYRSHPEVIKMITQNMKRITDSRPSISDLMNHPVEIPKIEISKPHSQREK